MSDTLTVGSEVWYTTRKDHWVRVRVEKVHYDDMPPYYTISGVTADANIRNRQTTRQKLQTGEQPPPVLRQYSAKSSAAVLKLAERSSDAAALFNAIDRDHDGEITTRELAEFFESRDDEFAKRLFKAIDVDDDGVIDVGEFSVAFRWAKETQEGMRRFFTAGSPDALFSQIDADSDGAITRRDLQAYLRDKLGGPDSAGDAARLLNAMDRDADGLIDRAEFCAAHRKAAGLPAPGSA
jgi:Ca2+-binding EF-hand superfamily protein